jgi:fatty-acyl-CoA synthase
MHFDRHVAYWARQRAGEPFMTFGDQCLTWDALDAQAQALAAHLLTLGIEPGDRFGILLSNCLEWCVGFAAAIRIGAIAVPLNARYGMFELQSIARDAECSALLSRPSEMKKLDMLSAQDGDPISVFQLIGGEDRTTLADIITAGGTAPRYAGNGAEPLILCYTSGTTGLPKGIVLTHDGVEAMAMRVGSRFGWELERERMLHLHRRRRHQSLLANRLWRVGLAGRHRRSGRGARPAGQQRDHDDGRRPRPVGTGRRRRRL